ncbi:MAG: GTP cyclohydrolase II [Methanothrix sp.]
MGFTVRKQKELFERMWSDTASLESGNLRVAERQKTPIVKMLSSTPLPTEYGGFTYVVFGDLTNGQFHTMMIYGDASRIKKKERLLLRVHSACGTSELFHATNCECREELEEALKRISKAKSGIVIYLNQEGAGNGITAKTKAYSNAFEWKNGKIVERKKKDGSEVSIYDAYKKLGYPQENRSFAAAAAMLKEFGIRKVRLMTNNPKKVEGLKQYGIDVQPYGIHIKPKNNTMKRHLEAKAKLLGHSIKSKDLE